jgi:hypothetical protein
MNESLEKLKAFLDDFKSKVRKDSNITDQKLQDIMTVISELMEAIEKLEKVRQVDEAGIKSLYENAQSLASMVDDLKRIRGTGYPSYIDEFVPSIAKPPFTMPKTLYEPQGAQQISVNIDGQIYAERAELALGLVFPGSATYRYGSPPSKVYLGKWFQSGRAHLAYIHELSPKHDFELKIGKKILRVYKPLTLRAFRMRGPRPLCVSCLSLNDGDENCVHPTRPIRVKLPSNYPVIIKLELSRKEASQKTLQKPMDTVLSKATFLKEFEVGLAVMGF